MWSKMHDNDSIKAGNGEMWRGVTTWGQTGGKLQMSALKPKAVTEITKEL